MTSGQSVKEKKTFYLNSVLVVGSSWLHGQISVKNISIGAYKNPRRTLEGHLSASLEGMLWISTSLTIFSEGRNDIIAVYSIPTKSR